MCLDFVVEVCFVVWIYVSPSISTTLFLVNSTDLLSDGFKLLIQEVEHMQFLLHEAASTKKLPDTSLSREHWSYWDLELSSRKKLSASWEKMSRNYQNKFIRFSSLCHIMWWSQYLHKFDWNDYNGLVWGQEAYPVANKGEYIREGYALRKSLKGLKYKKQKKEY